MAHLCKRVVARTIPVPSLLPSGGSCGAMWKVYCHATTTRHASTGTKRRGKPMTFEDLISEENKLRVQTSLERVKPVRTEKHVDLRPDHGSAAVLVPLCTVHGEPSLLFTLRSRELVNYRGQVSFPGGNVDASDPDVEFTALRETEEELGLKPSDFDIWGVMNALPTSRAGDKMVHPVLAQTGELDLDKLRLNRSEVEEVFAVSLRHLCHPEHIRSTRYRSKHSYTIPVYTGAAHRIWGLTAIMIHMLLMTLAPPDLYTFKLKHQRSYRPSNR